MAGSLDIASTTPATALLLARALTRRGDRARAAERLWRATSAAPGDFGLNLSLGLTLLRSGRHRPIEAVPFLTAAAALHPESAGTWLTLANALRRAHGRGYAESAYQKAEAAYRDALRRDPDDHLSRAYLGVILRSGGRMAEARDVLDPVRPGESESAVALQARGTLALALGDYEFAERCSRAALDLAPGFVLAHAYLGRALQNLGRFSEARHILLTARGLAGSAAGQAERSLEQCEAFCRQEGTSGRILAPTAYADYLRARGDCAAATEAYARALGHRHVGKADSSVRVRAARAAMRAAGGAGEALDPGTRERWLGLAARWLGDAIADWRDQVEREPVASVPVVRGALETLQLCGDLGIVRDREGLTRLPERRRGEWEEFWAQVAALRDRCERLRGDAAASPIAPGRGSATREGKARDGEYPDGPSRRRDDMLEPDPEGVGG
jgi:tetratricopeptide (TPR) repeat protein